jgi:hypothetical protein
MRRNRCARICWPRAAGVRLQGVPVLGCRRTFDLSSNLGTSAPLQGLPLHRLVAFQTRLRDTRIVATSAATLAYSREGERAGAKSGPNCDPWCPLDVVRRGQSRRYRLGIVHACPQIGGQAWTGSVVPGLQDGSDPFFVSVQRELNARLPARARVHERGSSRAPRP